MSQLAVPAPIGTSVLSRLQRSQLGAVFSLLRDLPADYPGADRWLVQRLEDALQGDADCWVATSEGQIAGLVILSPKPTTLKLSTIYVDERFRRKGIGAKLLDHTLRSAALLAREETFVTVAEHKVPILRPLLASRGFTCTALEKHRYGRDRHEFVFTHLATS